MRSLVKVIERFILSHGEWVCLFFLAAIDMNVCNFLYVAAAQRELQTDRADDIVNEWKLVSIETGKFGMRLDIFY